MPTRTLATMLLQYHQKETLVTRSTRSTGGIISFECIGHSLRRKQHGGGKPNTAQGEIEAARQLSKRADFSVVNTAEAVGLHHAVPNAPNKRNEHDSFEVPNGKGRADDNQENRRKDEAPFEALE